MLKRENEFEKDKRIEEMNNKYNIEELLEEMGIKKEEKE